MAPESSRKARAFAVWATLRAYGRGGYQAMVERHVGLARRVAQRVDEADDLERLADVQLNVVCFRYRPAGVPEDELDALNRRLGEAVLADGRVYVGTTTYGGRVAFRPAIVNYRSTEADIDLLVDVIRELGASLLVAGRQLSCWLSAVGLIRVARGCTLLPTYRLPTSDSRARGRELAARSAQT